MDIASLIPWQFHLVALMYEGVATAIISLVSPSESSSDDV
jgi:hypothetical protein